LKITTSLSLRNSTISDPNLLIEDIADIVTMEISATQKQFLKVFCSPARPMTFTGRLHGSRIANGNQMLYEAVWFRL
jgi:hypothetical protein